MSEWYKIKDQADVELSEDGKSIEIMFNTNYSGSQYIEVTVEFIKRVLKEDEIW